MNAIQPDHPRLVESSQAQRNLAAWILLAALASFAAMATPFFLGLVYVADDLGEFHLPVRDFYAQQLGRGEPFDWMPGLYGGFYLAGEGQLGAYHPLHLLAYRWLPLGAAFDLELLASYPLLFAGMFLFLRRLVQRRDAALFGALVFTFCGFNLLHFAHPNAVAIVAHLPWLLFAMDVALISSDQGQRAAANLAIGALTASQLLLGYPQYVWFSLLAEAAYVAWRAVDVGVEGRRIAPLVLAISLGMLGGAIQLVPTLAALWHSQRRATDVAFANTGSLHPLNLVQLVAPYLFRTRVVGQNTHELGLYVGSVPTLLCVWLMTQRRRWGRFAPLVRALIVFAALALLLAAGEFGGLYRLQSLVPLANRFRFPCRAIVLFELCVAVGAAVAIAVMFGPAIRREPADKGSNATPLAMALLVSVVLAIVGPLAWPEFVAGPLLVWCGPLLVGSAALLIALAQHGARHAAAALVVFAAVDLSCYGLSYSVYPHTADLHEFVASTPLPPGGTDVRVAVAAADTPTRVGDRMLLAGLKRVDGYAGLEPAKKLDYREMPALRLAGAAWVLQPASPTGRGPQWTAIEHTAPRARLVTNVVGPSQLEHLERLGLESAAVDGPLSLPTAPAGQARVLADLPGRITVETDAPTRQLLVTTESFDAGWRVLIDRHAEPVVRVNGDFLGCLVPAGKQHVVFEFRPLSLRVGALLSACGLGLMLCAFWFSMRHCGAVEVEKEQLVAS